mgnify:FL=1
MEGQLGRTAQEELREFVESIERLEEERRALRGDIVDRYRDAQNKGFSPKAIRQMVKERGMKDNEQNEQLVLNATYDVFRRALGMRTTDEIGKALPVIPATLNDEIAKEFESA